MYDIGICVNYYDEDEYKNNRYLKPKSTNKIIFFSHDAQGSVPKNVLHANINFDCLLKYINNGIVLIIFGICNDTNDTNNIIVFCNEYGKGNEILLDAIKNKFKPKMEKNNGKYIHKVRSEEGYHTVTNNLFVDQFRLLSEHNYNNLKKNIKNICMSYVYNSHNNYDYRYFFHKHKLSAEIYNLPNTIKKIESKNTIHIRGDYLPSSTIKLFLVTWRESKKFKIFNFPNKIKNMTIKITSCRYFVINKYSTIKKRIVIKIFDNANMAPSKLYHITEKYY
jgi:hypothetical protein